MLTLTEKASACAADILCYKRQSKCYWAPHMVCLHGAMDDSQPGDMLSSFKVTAEVS
jgi:hypothetical protein